VTATVIAPPAAPRPSSGRLLAALPLLFAAAVGLQMARDSGRRPFEPPAGMLWFRSGEAVKRMALGYDAILADLYWMRAVVYYGGQRLVTTAPPNYDLLYSLLDLVTTLDPRFNIAYRFGAIFLAEAYPSGPGRPDQAIALLERGIERTGRWEYMHDIGFVHYWWLRDYPKAAEWFERAAAVPGAPAWLTPLAATTLAAGGDRRTSRQLWEQLLTSSDTGWLKSNAEYRLSQLDAMDRLDRLNALADRYAAREGRMAQSWQTLAPALGLRGVPVDPTGVPFAIDPATGRISLGADSPLLPLPDEPPALPPAPPARPVP
jgi:tetratricopeptide (TPR) repeat protein